MYDKNPATFKTSPTYRLIARRWYESHKNYYREYYHNHREYYHEYYKNYVKEKSEYVKTYRRTYYMQNRARIIEQIKTRYRNYTIDNPVVVPNSEVVPKTYPKEIIVYFK